MREKKQNGERENGTELRPTKHNWIGKLVEHQLFAINSRLAMGRHYYFSVEENGQLRNCFGRQASWGASN